MDSTIKALLLWANILETAQNTTIVQFSSSISTFITLIERLAGTRLTIENNSPELRFTSTQISAIVVGFGLGPDRVVPVRLTAMDTIENETFAARVTTVLTVHRQRRTGVRRTRSDPERRVVETPAVGRHRRHRFRKRADPRGNNSRCARTALRARVPVLRFPSSTDPRTAPRWRSRFRVSSRRRRRAGRRRKRRSAVRIPGKIFAVCADEDGLAVGGLGVGNCHREQVRVPEGTYDDGISSRSTSASSTVISSSVRLEAPISAR